MNGCSTQKAVNGVTLTSAALTDSSGGTNPANGTVAVVTGQQRAGYMYLQNITAASTSGACDQLNVEGAAGGETVANIVQPDVPRNLVLNFTDGGTEISAFQVDVVGVAPDGSAATEQFLFAGGLDQVGSKIFAKITSVTLTSITETGATAKTLDIGYGVKLGVPLPAGSTGLSIVKLVSNGSEEAASATDTTNNSFTATTAPDGSKDYEVWYEYIDPVNATITAALAQIIAQHNALRVDVAALKTAAATAR